MVQSLGAGQEYEEVLTFRGTDTPIVRWAWTAGQTIRPNGGVLEGNPAMVQDYVPLTRRNYEAYARDLIDRAEGYISSEKSARRDRQEC